jgi:hypothetical protein
VFANPRCAEQFADSAALLVGHATSLWFDEFAIVVRRWEALADADGAHGDHQRAHQHRDAHVSIIDEHVYLDAHGGVAAGTVIEEIFARFCHTEFHTDWDADPPPLHPATVDQRRCETTSGHQIDPADMAAAVLTGHVRRVVFNTAGVVIDLGRRSRLFTGGARDAVLLDDRSCIWPGCDLRTGRCHTDHTTPWADTGTTDPHNAGITCPRHNRWKQHGYRT